MMEPGKIYKVAFDVGSLSQVFNKGHRIRVTWWPAPGRRFMSRIRIRASR